MSGPSNLQYLRAAKRTAALTPQQEQECDHVLIGVTSMGIPEEQWKDRVDLAVRMVTKPPNTVSTTARWAAETLAGLAPSKPAGVRRNPAWPAAPMMATPGKSLGHKGSNK